MDKKEIQEKIRFHLGEANKLKEELNGFLLEDKKKKFVSTQKAILEIFKSKYTIFAILKENGEVTQIDWEKIENQLFHEGNITAQAVKGEGFGLGYDETGMPCVFTSYYGGGGYTPLAIDTLDVERYVEREKNRRERERASKNA